MQTTMAVQVHDPVRMQFNTDVLKTLFHKGDQRMLDVLQDLKVNRDEEGLTCPDLKELTYSVLVDEGIDYETYDFDVSFNGDDDKEGYTGFEGKNLRVTGTAQYLD